MTGVLKVDSIQTTSGATPNAGDVGINVATTDMPAGSVLQMVSNEIVTGTTHSVNTNAWTQTSIVTPQITAKQANSKIKVEIQGYLLHVNGQAVNWGGGVTLYRNITGSSTWTQLSDQSLDGYYRNNQTSDHWDDYIGRLHFLDHSSTHAAGDVLNYRLYARRANRNTTAMYLHHVGGFWGQCGNIRIVSTLTEISV
jgi:hypothetical protein